MSDLLTAMSDLLTAAMSDLLTAAMTDLLTAMSDSSGLPHTVHDKDYNAALNALGLARDQVTSIYMYTIYIHIDICIYTYIYK